MFYLLWVFCYLWQINLNLKSITMAKTPFKSPLWGIPHLALVGDPDGSVWRVWAGVRLSCSVTQHLGDWGAQAENSCARNSYPWTENLSWKDFPHHLHIKIWRLMLQFTTKQKTVFIFKFCVRCQHGKIVRVWGHLWTHEHNKLSDNEKWNF